MNCKQGDLAVVVGRGVSAIRESGERRDILKPGTLVECSELCYVNGRAFWNLPTPFEFNGVFSDGLEFSGSFAGCSDDSLRPIRHPGDDAVDETIQRLGKPMSERVEEGWIY